MLNNIETETVLIEEGRAGAGDPSKILIGPDWIERSAKQDGLSSSWPMKLKRPSSVLTGKRWYAGQSKISVGSDWIASES